VIPLIKHQSNLEWFRVVATVHQNTRNPFPPDFAVAKVINGWLVTTPDTDTARGMVFIPDANHEMDWGTVMPSDEPVERYDPYHQ